jgi:ribosome-associated protein
MSKKNKTDEGLALCNIVVAGMEEKKAHDIVVMDLSELESASTDFFVICHGQSDTQVEAIAHSVEEEVKKVVKETPWHKEGYENNEWVLLDYVNVVVHVFVEEQRTFFGLEDLWGDAKITRY